LCPQIILRRRLEQSGWEIQRKSPQIRDIITKDHILSLRRNPIRQLHPFAWRCKRSLWKKEEPGSLSCSAIMIGADTAGSIKALGMHAERSY
jgi:hypothetical protein